MFIRKFTVGAAAVLCTATAAITQETEMEFDALHEAYVAKFKPLEMTSNLAWWEASISGTDDAYQRRKDAENALVELHGDRAVFAKLKSLKEAGQLKDAVNKRILEVMYNSFLPYQVDPALSKRIIDLEADVDQIFNTHRSEVDGTPKSENEVRKILSDTTDGELARKAWAGYMKVGVKVAPKLKELVTLRNKMARELGFANYFSLQMALQELDEKDLFKTFDELDAMTRKPFEQLKKEIDENMAKRFGVAADKLKPWHFNDLFFQEAPELDALSLDDVLKDKDPVKLAAAYYKSIGLPADDIIARSDLYEKEGKSPHAFCTSIDRDQDIRTLCNVIPNAYWMDTVQHELGHGVYDKYIGKDVPYVLHGPSHILTTEGVAMLFGAFSKNEEYLRKVLMLSDDEARRHTRAARRNLRAEKLIFSRWTQVMLRFEREMYANPDQDLNKLWWKLKRRYQGLNPPDDMSGADYGAKMHVVGAPVYYHNYMLGDLFACQVHDFVTRKILGGSDPLKTCFFGSKKAGDYMREQIFAPGNLYHWQELIKRATGEKLSARFFAAQYVN